MRRMLHWVHPHPFEMHAARWAHELGPELCAILIRTGILLEAPRANWYPCLLRCGSRMRIDQTELGRPLAVCGSGEGCADVALSDDQLRQYALSFERFVDLVREHLHVVAEGKTDPIAPDVLKIGTQRTAHGVADVFVAVAPTAPVLTLFLTARGNAARGSLVLLTSSQHLPETLLMPHGPGQRVEIGRIEDLLEVRDGQLVRASPSTHAPPVPPAPPFAYRLDAQGRAPLLEADYHAALGTEGDHDLFLDGTRMRARLDGPAGYVGSVRLPGGAREEFTLRPKEAAAVFELAKRVGKYILARDLVDVSHPERILHRARRSFDQEPYRFIQTRLGETKRAHSYAFDPDAQLRWVILLPA